MKDLLTDGQFRLGSAAEGGNRHLANKVGRFWVKKLTYVFAAAGLMTLAACGGSQEAADTTAVENTTEVFENAAESVVLAAENVVEATAHVVEATEAAAANSLY